MCEAARHGNFLFSFSPSFSLFFSCIFPGMHHVASSAEWLRRQRCATRQTCSATATPGHNHHPSPWGELTSNNLPTLTEVFPSSSDALLPPPALLVILIRLLLLGAGLTIALRGRCGSVPGDAGGELAMAENGRRDGLFRSSTASCLYFPGPTFLLPACLIAPALSLSYLL